MAKKKPKLVSAKLRIGKSYMVIQTPSKELDKLYLHKVVTVYKILDDLHMLTMQNNAGGLAITHPNHALPNDFVFRRWFDD